MADNSMPPPASLLGIAPELRNQIYQCVASSPGNITYHQGSIVPHALARTCHQARREFLPIFQTSGFEEGATIRIQDRCHNFDLFHLGLKMSEICGAASEKARRLDLVVSTTATDWTKMRQNNSRLWIWDEHIRSSDRTILSRVKFAFEVRVDCDALGKAGVVLLANMLDDLLMDRDDGDYYHDHDNDDDDNGWPLLRLVSAQGPLHRFMVDRLKKAKVPAELVMVGTHQLKG